MKCFSKSIGAILAFALLAGTAAAADTVSSGKIKSINADKKTFVLTDAADKDHTIKFGANLVVNRDGKESKSDLKTGDAVIVCYDKGLLAWTAHYILVQGGSNKSSALVRGSVKGYDADKKQLAFTDQSGKNWTFTMGDAKVRLNMQAGRVEDIKLGDHALILVETNGDNTILKGIMVDRR